MEKRELIDKGLNGLCIVAGALAGHYWAKNKGKDTNVGLVIGSALGEFVYEIVKYKIK